MRAVAYRNVYDFVGQRWLTQGDRRRATAAFAQAIRVSGRPAGTAIRIVWHAIGAQVLSRSMWGRRLQVGLATIRAAVFPTRG
jgi:hypothetical protein